MRRFLIVLAVAVALFAVVAPPVFAQAPTPKVTITGLFDQVTSAGSNFYDGNYTRTSDHEWYGRTRLRPDFVFEVGRTKVVMGLEVDLTYGKTTPCAANVSGAGKCAVVPAAGAGTVVGPTPGARPGTTSDSGLNNDTAGVVEFKWFYTEFDLTGKDSVLPFIPVPTVARAGGQPFASLANAREYATYAGGDFAGFAATTTWAPNLATKFAYVMVEDELAGQNRNGALGPAFGTSPKFTNGDDFAVIVSPEYTPMKGLNLKPMYSYFHAEGMTSAHARRSAINRMSGGFAGQAVGNNIAAAYNGSLVANPAAFPGHYAFGDPTLHEDRNTFGIEANWTMGAFAFKPVVYYQVGSRDTQCFCPVTIGPVPTPYQAYRQTAFMSSWLMDLVGTWQSGPFLLEVRGIYSTGNEARDNLAKRVSYFEPLDEDTSYYTGWAQILALGTDYFLGLGGVNGGMSTNVGYDRYGRAQLGVRGTYSLTPALALWTIISPTWTAEPVDTKTNSVGGLRTIVGDRSFTKGDSSYIGTEADLGTTWRFAPNVAFDLVGAWLFAGSALNTTECVAGTATGVANGTGQCGAGATEVHRDAKDAWAISSRVRMAF